MRRQLILSAILVSVALGLSTGSAYAAWSGYNYKALIFNGTGEQWAMQKFGWTHDQAHAYLGAYAHDHLIMKWTKAWQLSNEGPDGIRNSGDELPWTTDAWLNNEWNGAFPGGSGAVWHYKIKWFGNPDGLPDYSPLPDGGYVIWGEFEVLMDQGIDPAYGEGHFFFALAKPNGYGAN